MIDKLMSDAKISAFLYYFNRLRQEFCYFCKRGNILAKVDLSAYFEPFLKHPFDISIIYKLIFCLNDF